MPLFLYSTLTVSFVTVFALPSLTVANIFPELDRRWATSLPNPQAAFGDPTSFGQENDPIVGKPVGGIVVFGGGLALYTSKGQIVGGLGVSGGTSCSDHVIAWKVRHQLNLDAVPMGPSPDHNDNMILDIQNGVSASGFGHPVCKGGFPGENIIRNLSKNFPTGPKQ